MEIESVLISELKFDPSNARLHGPENIAAIAGSLETFGQRRPLVVRDDVVIAGNGTLTAATSLGWTEILVTQVPANWSDDQARAYALADNRTAELAKWDSACLAEQVNELNIVGYDLSEFGFTALRQDEPLIDFPAFDDETATAYCCPKCRYEWNGAPK